MFCTNCGKQIPDDSEFCPECGAKCMHLDAEAGLNQPGEITETGQSASTAAGQMAQTQSTVAGQTAQTQSTAAGQTAQTAANNVSSVAGNTYNAAADTVRTDGEQVKKSKISPKLIALIVAGVVVLMVIAIIAVIVIGGLLGGSKYGKFDKDDAHGYDAVYGWDAFIKKQNGDVIHAPDSNNMMISGDDSVAAYSNTDDEIYVIGSNGKPDMISENGILQSISMYGDTILYLEDYDEEHGDTANLYAYRVENGKSTMIASDVYNNFLTKTPDGDTISPDGKKILYITDYEIDDEDHTITNKLQISSIDGKIEDVDEDVSGVVGIDDKGHAYYFKDNKLYYYNGKESSKIASGFDNNYDACMIVFNKSLSEMLYTKDNKTYYYKAGKEDPVKVSSGPLGEVVYGYQMSYSFDYRFALDSSLPIAVIALGKDKLANLPYRANDAVYVLNGKCDGTDKIANGITYGYDEAFYDGFSLFSNEKCTDIMYIKNGKLYRKSLYSDNEAVEVIASGGIEAFVCDRSASKIYYVNYDGELMYNGKKPTLITDEVDAYSSILYSQLLNAVIYLEDGDLYQAKTDSKSAKLLCEDVSYYTEIEGYVFCIVVDKKGNESYFYIDKKGKAIELDNE